MKARSKPECAGATTRRMRAIELGVGLQSFKRGALQHPHFPGAHLMPRVVFATKLQTGAKC
eukprot:3292443-Alexandrium_andersonii.AAC.1